MDYLPLFYDYGIVKSHECCKVVPRLGPDDFYFLFSERERELKQYFTINTGETFVDVGSNVGYYSLFLARNNPKIKIIAIESTSRKFCSHDYKYKS